MTSANATDSRLVLRDALGVLFKRKRLIIGAFLVVALGISLAVLSLPNTYEVSGKLVVTRSRGDVLVTPSDSKNFNFAVTSPSVQDMAVHAELLKNRSLIESVARRLGMDRKTTDEAKSASVTMASLGQAFAWIPERSSGWLSWITGGSAGGQNPQAPEGRSRLDSAVYTITAGLSVQVLPNSNLIMVRYRSSDPAKGAEILNTLLALYLDQYLELRRNHGVTEFFAVQRDRIEDSLKRSEGALKGFQERMGLLSANVQVDAYARRLAEAENNATDAQFDAKEGESRVKILTALLATQPERIDKSSSTRLNPMIQTTQDRLLTLEMEKQKLLTLYTENDRRVTDKQEEIDKLKQRLGELDQWVPDIQVSEVNAARRDIEEKIIAAQLSAEKNRIRALGAAQIASEMRARVREIGLAEVERERLVREVQANAEAYLLYRKKVEEARITEAMDESKIVNVTIGEPASRQGTPVGPPKSLSLLFAVMVGLVSGVGGAFLSEFFDGSVKSEREIRAAANLPVLGSIPEEKKGKNGKNGKKNGNGNGSNGKNGSLGASA